MQPKTSRDYFQAGLQRLTAVEALLNANLTLDANYVGGYSVECALKALILAKTAEENREERLKELRSGAKMHRAEILLGILRDQNIFLPSVLSKRMRKFDWTTDLRYETGRKNIGHTKGFLRTCNKICQWVRSEL